MNWEKFTKKEDRPHSAWRAQENAHLSRLVVNEEGASFVITDARKITLPISGVCNVQEKSTGKKEYLVNNSTVALVLDEFFDISKFFRIPSVIPENLLYFSDGLFLGISKTREEIVSFKLGGPDEEPAFILSSYSVCARFREIEKVYAENEEVLVLHKDGVTALKPVM